MRSYFMKTYRKNRRKHLWNSQQFSCIVDEKSRACGLAIKQLQIVDNNMQKTFRSAHFWKICSFHYLQSFGVNYVRFGRFSTIARFPLFVGGKFAGFTVIEWNVREQSLLFLLRKYGQVLLSTVEYTGTPTTPPKNDFRKSADARTTVLAII